MTTITRRGAVVGFQWAKQAGQYVYPYECDPAFALEYQEAGKAGQ